MKSVNPPKILILTQGLGVGGLEKTLIRIAAGLKRRGNFEPQVYAYDQDPTQNMWSADLERAKIPCLAMLKGPGLSRAVIQRIRDIVRTENVQIVHTHDLNALVYGALAKFKGGGFKLVHTQHTFLHLDKLKHRIFERIFPRAADALVCPSQSLKSIYARHGFPGARIIANGIDIPDLAFRRADRAQWLEQGARGTEDAGCFEKLKTLSADRWVLVLGRVNVGKGQENFLDLWSEMDAGFRSRSQVLFVGPPNDPGYLRALKDRARALPDGENLHWVGGSARPSQWMGVSDVFVSLSDFEGMPLAPVEASLAGLPLVLSDIGGHRDLGLPATQFVNAARARDVQAAIEGAQAPSDHELNVAKQRYDLETMVEAYEKVYRELLGPGVS
jgi:glycosyltransferase involved in cell wall biosynthesis